MFKVNRQRVTYPSRDIEEFVNCQNFQAPSEGIVTNFRGLCASLALQRVGCDEIGCAFVQVNLYQQTWRWVSVTGGRVESATTVIHGRTLQRRGGLAVDFTLCTVIVFQMAPRTLLRLSGTSVASSTLCAVASPCSSQSLERNDQLQCSTEYVFRKAGQIYSPCLIQSRERGRNLLSLSFW